MQDAFISYCSRDRDIAFRMQEGLANRNLSVGLTITEQGGGILPGPIKLQLDQCLVAIALWSQESARSVEVLRDAERAPDAGKLLSVFLEHCDPPLSHWHIQPHNLEGWRGDAS